MNHPPRSSYPSQEQIEALMEFLSQHPRLASGVPTVPSARDRTRKLWEKQSVYLNSLGGSYKSWRQWRKYWADKKNAVKKKAAQRFAERAKGGDEKMEITILSDTEERILGVMGCEGFDAEEIHNFNGIKNAPPSPPNDMSLASPEDMQDAEEQPESSEYESMEGRAASLLSISLIEQADVPSPLAATANSFSNSNPQACNHTVESSPALNAQRRTHYTNPHRGRRMTQPAISPSFRRQSQFFSLAERFLRVEENRLEMDRRYATIIENLVERDKERDRTVAQALTSLGDSLRLIADALKK